MITPTTIWTDDFLLGFRKRDRSIIYLRAPSWDCGWYWGLGYLGNKREHYHLDDYANGRNINMHDALCEDYDLAPYVQACLWKFCDLMSSAYTLAAAAEIYHRGHSNYTRTGIESILKNQEEHERINGVLLPAIFDQVHYLVTSYVSQG